MPPITTAMIASNSFWVPRSVSAEPVDSTWIAAKIVAVSAVSMNSVILVRATGTPRLRAATGIAAAGEDPVAEAGAHQHPGEDQR